MEQKKVELPIRTIVGFGLVFVILIAVLFYYVGRDSAARTAAGVMTSSDSSAVSVHAEEPASVAEPAPAARQVNMKIAGMASERSVVSASHTSAFNPAAVTASGKVKSEKVSASRTAFTPIGMEKKTAVQAEAAPNMSLASSNNAADVQRYFDELDSATNSLQTGGDPNAFAEQLLRSIMSGDFSQFDQLISDYSGAIAKIENINAPSDCLEHKNSVLSTMRDSVQMLTRIKSALNSGNVDDLSTMNADSEKLKSNAERTDRLMKEIKAKYNLK